VNRFNTTYGFLAVGSHADRRRRLTSSRDDRARRLSGDSTEYGSADCSTIFAAMQYSSWYDFGKKVEYQPHGPIHTLVGGVSGADYRQKLVEANVDLKYGETWVVSLWTVIVKLSFIFSLTD